MNSTPQVPIYRTFAALFGIGLFMFFGPKAGFTQSNQSSSRVFRLTEAELKADLDLSPLDSAKQIDKLVLDELKLLNQVSGRPVRAWQTSRAELPFAHPNAGIIVNTDALRRQQQKSGVKRFREFLRLILAHEMAHQVQFSINTFKAMDAADADQRRVYECQADMLAGKYLIETMNHINQPDEQITSAAILDALKASFDIGTEEYSIGAHPSHEQRRSAVRLGMASGMIANLRTLPLTPEVQGSITTLVDKVNIRPGEEPFRWSARQAKRIVHFSRAATVDLIVSNRRINWDKRATNPVVSFEYTYENTGRKALAVEMEVQCAAVPRENQDDTLKWLRISQKNFAFTLQPGEKHTVTGTLQWYADEKLMPLLVAPPDTRALFSCE